MKTQHETLPIKFTLVRRLGDNYQFHEATFTQQFGIFTQDETHHELIVNFIDGTMTSGDKSQQFKIFPCFCNTNQS